MDKNKLRIIMTLGLPGSGKSTWAKEQVNVAPKHVKRICKDDLRMMLHDNKYSGQNEQFILQTRNLLINQAIQAGFSAIVDDCNLHPKHRLNLDNLANKLGVEFEIKDFTDVPLETCLERNLRRAESVPEKVIKDMYKNYIQKPIEPYPVKYGLPWTVLCDLDGTLALKSEKRGYYEWDKVSLDRPCLPVMDLLKLLSNSTDIQVILMSGRDAICRKDTEQWLADSYMGYSALHMRQHTDMRDDVVVKTELFNEYIKDKYNVFYAIDDRPKIVKMYKDMGIFVFNVNQDPYNINF